MEIVFITDENYALATRVAVRSAMQNAVADSAQPLTVHVICVETTPLTVAKFRALGARVIEKDNRFAGVGQEHRHVSKAAMWKFDLPKVFPELDRILYLDSDVIVSGDLREFYDLEFAGNYAAMARDISTHDPRYHEKLGLRDYFNSGVILLNLAAMRHDNIPAQLLEYKINTHSIFMDQDAFNMVLGVRVVPVSRIYNVMLHAGRDALTELGGMENWRIIHYAARKKPWNDMSAPLVVTWMKHLSPEDFHTCLAAWFASERGKTNALERTVSDLKKRLAKLEKSRFFWRALFYEKRVDTDGGVKRKFKLFGLGIWSLRKRQNLRVARVLGVKISWHHGLVLIDPASGLRYLDRARADKKINRLRKSGVLARHRQRRLIVSLTSFPARMYDIHYCLYSLLTQQCQPDRVILWLAPAEFPNGEGDVPPTVTRLKKFGLEIRWCEDLKSYKKLLPALAAFPDEVIVTADDDIFYPPDWLEKLSAAHRQRPGLIHCHRAHFLFNGGAQSVPYHQWRKCVSGSAPSVFNFLTGCGGVLFPPGVFHPDVTRRELWQKLCPTTDDVWFWGMAVLRGTKINVVNDHTARLVYVNLARETRASGEPTLVSVNLFNGGNERALNNLLAAYPALTVALQAARYDELGQLPLGRAVSRISSHAAPGAPKVSVVVPVFNVEKFLPRALDSLAAQTLADLEIICVDDGSTDGSAAMLRRYADRDRRYKIITQPNGGAGAARNAGLAAATGETLIFLDSDDYFQPLMLEKLYTQLTVSGADLCCCNYDEDDAGTVRPGRKIMENLFARGQTLTGADCPAWLFQLTNGAPWNKLWRADFVRQTGVGFGAQDTAEDTVFVYRHMATAKITRVGETLLRYTVRRKGALTADKAANLRDTICAYTVLHRQLAALGLARELNDTYYRAFANSLKCRFAPDTRRRIADRDLKLLRDFLRSALWRHIEEPVPKRDELVENLKRLSI
ncbi:MAG: glycosyltransferase [Verrucomicrobiales bacterium]|jgi:lipopolysaccharide biosynthesis glycosyltransferase/glycosyltransferase involved in cell wall biosynthesis|nr:glycosyltransferase [Verrucomicrobiales bacterium]